MPPENGYAIIEEYEDEHGGTVVEVRTTDEIYLQEKTVKPGQKQRIVTPDGMYGALKKVTVEPIPKAAQSTLNLADGYLTGILSKRSYLIGGIVSSTKAMTATVAKNSNRYPYFDGPYVVEPSAHTGYVLETEGLLMADNVVINKIYYAEVSNLKDGVTAYIADH